MYRQKWRARAGLFPLRRAVKQQRAIMGWWSWREWMTPEWILDEDETCNNNKEDCCCDEQQLRNTRPTVDDNNNNSIEDKSQQKTVQLCFGGCGGMYSYFLGVAAVIQEHFILDNVIFSGASAGCFPALFLALGFDIEEEFNSFHADILSDARSHRFRALGNWIPIVKKHTLEKLRNNPEAYVATNHRLYCSLTSFPSFQNKLVGCFTSNEDLVSSVLASASVPIYAPTWTQSFRGEAYIDGSLTNNSPLPHGSSIPSKVLQVWHWRRMNPAWALISTKEDWTRQLFEWGKADALKNIHELEAVLTKKY